MTPFLHIRNLLDFVSVNYLSHGNGMRVLDAFLFREGQHALPGSNFVLERLQSYPVSMTVALLQISVSLIAAKVKCRRHYRMNTYYPPDIPARIAFSKYAYSDPPAPVAPAYWLHLVPGVDVSAFGGIPLGSLDASFGPAGGSSGYDHISGHVHVRNGFNAYIKRSGNNIHVAFRGTDTGHYHVLAGNVLTDWFQLYSCDFCYVRAAGLLRHLLTLNNVASIEVTGHSLGGGLTQFAVAANQPTAVPVTGTGFNSAGLSNNSLNVLGHTKLTTAAGALAHVVTRWDPVSTCGGGLVGGRYRIPRVPGISNGHGLADLAACFATLGGVAVPFYPR